MRSLSGLGDRPSDMVHVVKTQRHLCLDGRALNKPVTSISFFARQLQDGARESVHSGYPTYRRVRPQPMFHENNQMLNGLLLYIAFNQSALQYRLTFTHSYTDGGANHAR